MTLPSAILPLAAVGTAPAGAGLSGWLPEQAAVNAHDVDWVFNYIFGICLFFFLLIAGLTIYFVLKYRRRPGDPIDPEYSPTHNTPLEVLWTGIPLVLVITMFYYGFAGYLDLYTPPENAIEIQVHAEKWNWTFTYPNGWTDSELHVPVDRNIRLVMSSSDVIHSFFVPAFRTKMDVVPGRYHKTWFRATRPGKYRIFCAEYCGTSHSDMLSWIHVYPPGGYETWLAEVEETFYERPPAEVGRDLFLKFGCPQCHNVDSAAAGIGPSLKNLFGRTEVLDDGTSLEVDENYVRESILYPQAKKVAGYDPVMPTFSGRLDDRDVDALIAYLKSLP